MAIHPTEEQMQALMESKVEGSVRMLNLLKFRDRAEYEDGSDGGCRSGMEAYLRYSAALADGILDSVGATVFYGEPVVGGFIGEAGDSDYDMIAIVNYPSIQAFLDMVGMPAYEEAAKHREAGLERQVLIGCSGNEPALPAS